MAKRILVVHATAGAGHQMAAKALEEALGKFPDAEFLNIDVLAYTNLIHKRIYADSYLALVNYMPVVWGYLYDQFEKKNDVKLANNLLSFFDLINAAPLFKLIKEYKPDHIINTHFLGSELLNSNRKEVRLPNSVVITDYDAHNFWLYDVIDHYFVATNEVKDLLVHKGVKPEMVSVTGIPVRDKFTHKQDVDALRKKWKINPDLVTVLMMSGGFGTGGVKEIVKTLLRVPQKYNLVVVTGRNKPLYNSLKKLKKPAGINFQVEGFVEPVHELMTVADLMVTKAGGLSVTEGLVMGLPMVLTDPIPGQEERNADYLIEVGAGVKAHSLISLESHVSRLIAHPDLLDRMHHRAKEVAKPEAAREIIQKVLNMSEDSMTAH